MAKNITQLNATTTLAVDDVTNVVDVSANLDKKITMANFWSAKPYGELYLNGNTTDTTISVAGTKVNITTGGITTSSGIVNLFTHTAASGRLTYNGTNDVVVEMNAAIDIGVNGGTDDVSLAFYINGSMVTKSEIRAGAGDYTAINPGDRVHSIQCLTTLSENDYIEIYVANEDATTDVRIQYLNFYVKAL